MLHEEGLQFWFQYSYRAICVSIYRVFVWNTNPSIGSTLPTSSSGISNTIVNYPLFGDGVYGLAPLALVGCEEHLDHDFTPKGRQTFGGLPFVLELPRVFEEGLVHIDFWSIRFSIKSHNSEGPLCGKSRPSFF